LRKPQSNADEGQCFAHSAQNKVIKIFDDGKTKTLLIKDPPKPGMRLAENILGTLEW
jgi:hypothetical protein